MIPLGNLILGLINIQSITDDKLAELDEITKDNHMTFFTELNIKDDQKLNIICSDKMYNWHFIKSDFTKEHTRIGLRYPSKYGDNIKVNIVDQGRLNRPERVQASKCVIQYISMNISFWNKCYSVILAYRTPDCDEKDANRQKTQDFFSIVDAKKPHLLLGDLNLNFDNEKDKFFMENLCSMKQIVKLPTRVAPAKNNTISKTIIDHVWVKPSISNTFKTKCIETSISDHKFLQINIKSPTPKVKVELPISLDKHRRYFPNRAIDWTKVRFKFSQNIQDPNNTDTYYKNLENAVKQSCDNIGIVPRTTNFSRKTFRFHMSIICRDMKSKKNYLRRQCTNLKKEQQTNSAITDEQVNESFNIYKKFRNIYNRQVKKERKSHFSTQFMKFKNDAKRCWSIVNRSKGVVRGEIEDLKDEIFEPNNMANFFQERSKIALNTDFPNIPNTFEEIYKCQKELTEYNIKINQEIISEAMSYKAHSNPDPDGLSMMIWNKFYENVPAAKIAINKLFVMVFENSFKIPGLETHHIHLHLKVADPKRQKDLRPIASLNSLPKRMLRILFMQLKEANIANFYSKTD